MNRPLEEALAQCLARLEQGASIEQCLRDHQSLAGELRPLVEAAQALRRRGEDIPQHSPQAFYRGRARMQAVRAGRTESSRAPWAGLFSWRTAGLAAVAAVIALLAFIGFAWGMFGFDAGTTSAQVEGTVSRVDPDAIVLLTDDGRVIIRIGENTVVLDANGNVISGGDIVPGRQARVKVEGQEGSFAAQRIEVEDDGKSEGTEVEFSGVINTIGGTTISIQATFGVATVHIDSQTEVNGTLAVGATVEVHATLQGDGSYLGRKIEVKGTAAVDEGTPGPSIGDGGHDDDDRDEDHHDKDESSSDSGISESSGFGQPTSGSGDDDKDKTADSSEPASPSGDSSSSSSSSNDDSGHQDDGDHHDDGGDHKDGDEKKDDDH